MFAALNSQNSTLENEVLGFQQKMKSLWKQNAAENCRARTHAALQVLKNPTQDKWASALMMVMMLK